MNNKKAGIRIKRIYEEPEETDGRRLLVGRLWARGLSKEEARVDAWIKEIAPSNELRRWYGHDADRWAEFKKRYADELDAKPDIVKEFIAALGSGVVTLLYSSKEEQLNNATALKEYIETLLAAEDG